MELGISKSNLFFISLPHLGSLPGFTMVSLLYPLVVSVGLYGVPKWLSGKESACRHGGMGLIPGLGRSPGGGNGNPLQYSCLKGSMDEEPGRLQSIALQTHTYARWVHTFQSLTEGRPLSVSRMLSCFNPIFGCAGSLLLHTGFL